MLCAPGALPGDEYWTWREHLWEALSLMRGDLAGCYYGGVGETLQDLAQKAVNAAWIGPLLVIGWECVVRPLRRRHLRRSGNHVAFVGECDSVRAFGHDKIRKGRAMVFVAPTWREAWRIANAFPFQEVVVAVSAAQTVSAINRLGLGSAAIVAVVTERDIYNLTFAEEIFNDREGKPAKPQRLAVRIEQPVVRQLRSQGMIESSQAVGVSLLVLSLSMLQVRNGLFEAMPGRFITGEGRWHIAICGTGALMPQITQRVARQGYGLETAVPRLSVLRTGWNDFPPGSLEKLQAATLSVEISTSHSDPQDIEAFERAIAAAASSDVPLASVHCTGDTAEEALAIALRWERVLMTLRVPVPPIVTYGPRAASVGRTGMIRIVPQTTPCAAATDMEIADRRAIALHENYYETQKAVRGAEFGQAPAERPWSSLGEGYKDDNRNVADHIAYKLARVGYKAVDGDTAGRSAVLGESDIALLAELEHGRWMASKNLQGITLGPRSSTTHPDLIPYADLDQATKEKDVDSVRMLPRLLEMGGQFLRRLQSDTTAPVSGEALPLSIFDLDDLDDLAKAERARDGTEDFEVVLGPVARDRLADFAHADLMRRMSAVLRSACVIRHAERSDVVSAHAPASLRARDG